MYENYNLKFAVTAVLIGLAVLGLTKRSPNLGLDLSGGAELVYRLEARETGYIGLDVREPKANDRDKQGLYVTSVKSNSPAFKAGIRPNDIIKTIKTKAGDRDVYAQVTEFQKYVEQNAGSEITLGYYSARAAQAKTAVMTVERQKGATKKLANNVVEVLKKRLDGFGLKEMSIQTLGSRQIVIQIPGASPSQVEDIQRVVAQGGNLSFHIIADSQTGVMDSERTSEIKRIFNEKATDNYYPDYKYDIALNTKALGDRKPETITEAEAPSYYVLLKNRESEKVSGKYLSDAYRTLSNSGVPSIGFSWTAAGSRKFYKMTSNNISKGMAVVLDGNIVQIANIRSAISSAGYIEGGRKGFSEKEIRSTVIVLKGGALQAKPILQSKNEVGPRIGQASYKIGQIAIVLATILVLGFMIMFYKGSGIIACIALVLNLTLILGSLTIFEATLTLPGIAGILLTAGMAVDANILIFERIREELEKEAGLKQAVQAGYDRAFWTIFDANLTTFITALILFYVGTGPIKGFAVTLMIGILCSMFTALYVTQAIYGYMIGTDLFNEMKMARLLDKTNINFMAMRGRWGFISLVLINIGFALFLARGKDKLGIDFTGGSVVQITLAKQLSVAEVQAKIGESKILHDVDVVMVGAPDAEGKGNGFQLKTREVASALVDTSKGEAPKKAETGTKSEDLFRQEVEKQFKSVLLDSLTTKDGKAYTVQKSANGKVKLVFDVVLMKQTQFSTTPDPTVSIVNGVFSKLASQKMVAATGATAVEKSESASYKVFTVTSGDINAGKQPEAGAHKRLIKGLERSGEVVVGTNFPRVSAIGASVAYDLKAKAIMSLFLSLLAIVLYITIRFEFRFGVAAIAALVHDVLIALGFMALVDWFCSSAGIAFDAKINLPTVAAFLTIVGYSLNDTIVVFDRIRETMGKRKLKGLDETELVNTAINQTLSRTLLTSLTTFLVVLILFVASLFGLQSIQGLSLALLVGVIVGTYSSIFVASSVLVNQSELNTKIFLGQLGLIFAMLAGSFIIG